MSSSYTHPYSYASTSKLYETLPSPQAESDILDAQEDMWFDSEDPAEYAMAATYGSFNLTDLENDQLGDSGSPQDLPVFVDVQMEEGFREMEQYINYDEDPNALSENNIESRTPAGRQVSPTSTATVSRGALEQSVWPGSANIHCSPSYFYSLPSPAFYTLFSSPLAPSAPVIPRPLPSPRVAITASSSKASTSTTLDPKLLFGGNRPSKVPRRKRDTSSRVRKTHQPDASQVAKTAVRRTSAFFQRTKGELTPDEINSLPSAEVTERVVRSNLRIADSIELKDAWPQGPDPWDDLTRPQVVMLAICCHDGHRATLQQIQKFIVKKYPGLSTTKSCKEWRSTIRNNLSGHPQFRRLPCEQGHGGPWTLDVTKIR